MRLSRTPDCAGDIDEAINDGRPSGLLWKYDRKEIRADALVHGAGVGGGLLALVPLIDATRGLRAIESASVWVYGAGLLAMLGLSAAYNLWPVSRGKWMLRRCDQCGIYVMIAATFTPLSVHGSADAGFPTALWVAAAAGIVATLWSQNRFNPWSVARYFALAWGALLAYAPSWNALSSLAAGLIAAGCLLYATGALFHLRQQVRFHNAIWHAFVLAAAGCHYLAILDCIA
jgi:hemolysin III